jgi:hypothetical protein
MPNKPPAEMSLAEVQAELRRVTGLPWTDEADGARRQTLWRRLDQLVADGTVSTVETVPAAEGEVKSGPAPSDSSPSPASLKPPDLQELVDRAGRRHAAELGEDYVEDPFKRPPHQGGYPHITADEWAEFDQQMAEWKASRGIGTGVAGKKQP